MHAAGQMPRGKPVALNHAEVINMANVNTATIHDIPTTGELFAAPPVRQAYQILRVAFTLAPILAGLDKFFHLLVNWDIYLAPWLANLSPIGGHNLMLVAGVIEIVAGLIVAFWPRVGAILVFVWLWGIIINLLTYPGYYDIALRDFGLSLGVLALARLSSRYQAE